MSKREGEGSWEMVIFSRMSIVQLDKIEEFRHTDVQNSTEWTRGTKREHLLNLSY